MNKNYRKKTSHFKWYGSKEIKIKTNKKTSINEENQIKSEKNYSAPNQKNQNNEKNSNKIIYSNDNKYYNFINDKEYKYMDYDHQNNNENDIFEIYKHYIFYNEPIFYIIFNDDFNHKYLKFSLFVFYLECIILFNFIIFPNKIFSKIYDKKKYPFSNCLIYNFLVVLISIIIIFCSKILIGTQYKIFENIKEEEKKIITPETKNSDKENNNFIELDLEVYEKKIKKDKKRIIKSEIKNKKFLVFIYFIGVSIVFFYSFIHGISFGIYFPNTQKFIILNMVICYVIGFIFSLIINLILCFLRFFGIKNESEMLFNLSFW